MSVTRAVVTSVALAGALAAGAVSAPGTASAATTCTAWGSLPAHVRLGERPVTVHMVLRGTAGCHTHGVDNGATATLRGPGARDPQRWSRFGGTDTQTFQLRVNKLGRYTLESGDVQLYNSREELVHVHWRRTSTLVTKAH